MTTQIRRPRSTREALSGLDFALSVVSRPNPLVIGWRWRYEIGLATGSIAAAAAIAATAGPAALLGCLGGAAVACCLPWVRSWLLRRAWCVITPHRVRTACAQAWIHSRKGKIPIVVLTTSEPFGERVRVWCRAGTCPQDFVPARGQLAAACWAIEVQVAAHPRFAQLAVLDVIRFAERQRPAPPAVAGRTGSAQRPPAPWPWRNEPAVPGGDSERAA